MSVKKQNPILCKLYSFYEEIPEEFSDETDVYSYFYLNIYDNYQSQHRIVRVSRRSKKTLFAIKLFQFCDLKTQQRYILQEEVNNSKKELTYLVDSLRDFLETFDHASKCLQIPLPEPRVEIGSTKSKDNLSAHKYSDIIENQKRQYRLTFRLGNNISFIFSIKMFELPGNQYIPTEIVNLNQREIHQLYKN